MATRVLRLFIISLLIAASIGLAGSAGCKPRMDDQPPASSGGAGEGTAESENADNAAAADLTANEILAKLLKTYRAAKTYSDNGLVTLRFQQDGQQFGEQSPCSVQFVRPNKLALHAFQAKVVCDGQKLQATIDDPTTGNVDGQVLDRPAPQQLKLTDLASDALLYDILSSKLRRQPVQLELLLESSGLASAFDQNIACRRLDDASFDGHECYRVEVPSPGGPFVFWVDQQQGLLRRLEYPAAALLPEVARDPTVSELSLSADLHDAQIGEPIDDSAFELQAPPSPKFVRSFVVPPRPLPSKLFSRQPGEFFFTDLNGDRVGPDQWLDAIVVLAWYHDNPACAATLHQVSEAARQFADNDQVKFFAVSTDPTSTSGEAIEQRLREWEVELPVVRDLEAFGDKVFQIELQPTIVVLDKQGRVQIFQTGGNPQLAAQLGVIVDRLLRGDDLAADIVRQAEREREEYDKLIAEGGPEPTPIVELAEAVIRQRSEPKNIALTKLWETKEIRMPGNAYFVGDEQPRLYVIEAGRRIVELAADGQVIDRHELPLPEGLAVTFLRTAVTKEGERRFVLSSPLAPCWFVFDENWQPVGQYPEPGADPLQIVDLQLADLNDDEQPDVLAGNVNLIGLHAVSLAGEPLWRNRKFANVTSVAVTRPDDVGSWGILVTGESGGVLRVNRFGNDEPEEQLPGWAIVRLSARDFDTPSGGSLLGIASSNDGKLRAVSLDDRLKQFWTYDLPAGVHQRPIEPIVASQVRGEDRGEWWLAGPDGSIHLLSDDGEFHDSFCYGAVLNGVAAATVEGRGVLVVSTDGGVTGYEIEIP